VEKVENLEQWPSCDCNTTAQLYTWFFKTEKGEPLTTSEKKRKAFHEKLLEDICRLRNEPQIEMTELLANIELKSLIITVIKEKVNGNQLSDLYRLDIQNALQRRKKIQTALKNGKKELVFKLLSDKNSSTVHVVDILYALAENEDGFKKIDLINEAFWAIHEKSRTKPVVNKLRDQILLEEAKKVVADIQLIESRLDRIKALEKLYIKVQAPQFPGQQFTRSEAFVKKKGDEVALRECPLILEDIDKNHSGFQRLNAIKELYGMTRVHSRARQLVVEKWDSAAAEEYQSILLDIEKTSEGIDRLQAVRNLWQATRMGSETELKLVERWERIVSLEYNKVLSEIAREKNKHLREEKINRLWVTIARFPEKRKAFKEAFDQMAADDFEEEDVLELHY
jgi:hypothetical protein